MEKQKIQETPKKRYRRETQILTGIMLSLILSLPSCDQKKMNQQEIHKETNTTQYNDSLWNVGIEKLNSNNFSESLEIFIKLETIYLKEKNDNELWNIYRFMGVIFLRTNDNKKALEYFEKALKIAEQCNNKRGIVILHAHIGEALQALGKNELAINMFFQGLEISNQTRDTTKKEIEAKATINADIARRYLRIKNNTDSSKIYRKEAIRLFKQTDNMAAAIGIKYDIGDFYFDTKNYTKALKYYKEGIETIPKDSTNKYAAIQIQKEIGYEKLGNRYRHNGDFKEAFENKLKEDSLRNQRINEESTQQINELNIKYETEKKDNEIKLQDVTIEKQSEQKKRILWTAIGALIAALGASRAAVTALKSKNKEKKHKEEVTKQKELVEEINHQLEETNDQLKEKNAEVEASKQALEAINKELAWKNKNITDSIHYGRRIQEGFLQNPKDIKKLFPESFIFFQPKDIVSGDFYRFKETKSGKKLIAAVDCTGHGVPGAFLTIIGNNILNEAIKKDKEKPAEILNFLSEGINEQLKKKEDFQGDAIKDAMDIAIFSYDPKTNEFESAGAYNTIYIFKKGQMQKIKGDKLAIGNEKNEYSNQILTIEPGSTVYLGTDGFADQFGGQNNKKMMKKRMTRLLEDLQKMQQIAGEEERRFLTMEEQKKKVEDHFNEWKGSNEQTDDVLLIGIKV